MDREAFEKIYNAHYMHVFSYAMTLTGDRHLAEFVPRWYTMTPETVTKWKFGLTTVDWREDDLVKRLKRSDDLISGKEQIDLTPSGEEGHLLLKALLGLGDLVSNVNVPNRGQCPDLPLGAVVETNALFGLDRIQPVYAGYMPKGVLPLVTRHVQNQENALRAILDGADLAAAEETAREAGCPRNDIYRARLRIQALFEEEEQR